MASWVFFFFSLPPLIYTVCSETHQGLFGLGVCFGDRPRISALRVGTAISAAPGGPAGHKTSRGLLLLSAYPPFTSSASLGASEAAR